MKFPGQSVAFASRVTADDAQGHALACREAVAAARDHRGAAERVDVGDVEPPGDEVHEASCAAGVRGASEPFPITAMPTLPALKPSVCAPITGRSMPPARPS